MDNRSTTQYLNKPFRPGSGTRQLRLAAINQNSQSAISPPSEYCDAYSDQLMDNPCDIRISTIIKKEYIIVAEKDGSVTEKWVPVLDEQGKPVETTFISPPCYVDASARHRYNHHPSGNTDVPWSMNWANEVYKVNHALSQKIEAWLRIEEIRKYVISLSTARRVAFPSKLPYPFRKALFATSANVLKHSRREEEEVPAEFRSALSGKIMTLPVRLNGDQIIDFEELFITEDHSLSAARYEIIMEDYRAYLKEDLAMLESECARECVNFLDTVVIDSMEREEEKNRLITEAHERFQRSREDRSKTNTLEWFAEHLNIPELLELLPRFKKYLTDGILSLEGENTRALKRIKNAEIDLAKTINQLNKLTGNTRATESIKAMSDKNAEMFERAASQLSELAEDSIDDEMVLDDDIAANKSLSPEEKKIASCKKSIREIITRVDDEEKKIAEFKIRIETFKQKTTFEWYVRNIGITESTEYVHPITKEAITSIEVEQELLKRIDDWIDPLKEQIRTVEKHVANYASSLELGFKANYAQIMQPYMEQDSAPHKVLCYQITPCSIPGTRDVEIGTDPVLLDDMYVIDYGRLKEYWGSKGLVGWLFSFVYDVSWFGYNPFTGQKCRSIAYMHPLKQETDKYMKSVWCATFFKPRELENKKLLLTEEPTDLERNGFKTANKY